MAEAAKKTDSGGTADKWLGKLNDWVSEKISTFVAFLFLLFAAGAFYGAFIVPRLSQYSALLLIAPLALAAIAYYSRGVALVLFAGIVLVFIL